MQVIIFLVMFLCQRFKYLCLEPMSNTDTLKEKKIVRTAEEVRKMTATQYLDELVVPILNKALITVNKEVRFFFSSNQSSPTAKQYRTVVFSRHLSFFALKRPVNPIEFLGNHLIKVANEPPSPEETKSISSASTPTPMD